MARYLLHLPSFQDETKRRLALFLPESPQEAATLKLEVEEDNPDEAVGQTLGRYKLLGRVGEGGCGVVYVAEQTEPVRRRVALKVIKLGALGPPRAVLGTECS